MRTIETDLMNAYCDYLIHLRITSVRMATAMALAAAVAISAGLGLSIASTSALAVQPGEVLADKALEKRARKLSTELRCLVCQNQSIDESDAPLAKDLRLLVRERLTAGDSDEEIIKFIVARYGEFVLLRPPFAIHTLLLWLAPLFVLFGGFWLARTTLKSGQSTASGTNPAGARLSDAEQARLKELLAQNKSDEHG